MSADTSPPLPGGEIPPVDPASFLPRASQVQWDHYYMEVAETVRSRANCLGARVGAVLVLENRIVSTGFNGTPAGFPNCMKGGCERCKQRFYADIGRDDLITDRSLARGPKQLDLCLCVHAEANALLSAAKFGNRTEGATLYTTHKPCFSCVKESTQAGVERVVWLKDWKPSKSKSLQLQYEWLAEHLRRNDARNFEQLGRQDHLGDSTGVSERPPNLDDRIGPDDDKPVDVTSLEPSKMKDELSKPKPKKVAKPKTAGQRRRTATRRQTSKGTGKAR